MINMIGEAFRLRRERRGIDIKDLVKTEGICHQLIRQYEDGNLHFTENNALNKLNALNRKWVEEEH